MIDASTLRHADRLLTMSISGGRPKWPDHVQNDANDPDRTSRCFGLGIGLTGRHDAPHLRATCLPSPLAAEGTLERLVVLIKARAVPVPSDVLAPLYVGADPVDAFAIHLPARASDDLEAAGARPV